MCEDVRLNGISIFLSGYETNYDSAEASVRDAANDLWSVFNEYRADKVKRVIDHAHILFVCHSQGGVVARDFLVKYAQKMVRVDRIGLALYGSPSTGSYWATFAFPVTWFFGHIQAQQLRYGNVSLATVDDSFRSLLKSDKRISGIEGREHLGIFHARFFPWLPKVVPATSAGRYFESRLMARTNHFNVAKPRSLTDPQHRLLVVDFLQETWNAAKADAPVGAPVYPENSKPNNACARRPVPKPRIMLILLAILLALITILVRNPNPLPVCCIPNKIHPVALDRRDLPEPFQALARSNEAKGVDNHSYAFSTKVSWTPPWIITATEMSFSVESIDKNKFQIDGFVGTKANKSTDVNVTECADTKGVLWCHAPMREAAAYLFLRVKVLDGTPYMYPPLEDLITARVTKFVEQ